MYYSHYEGPALQLIADCALSTAAAGFEPWVMFGLTAHGHATSDALALREMVSSCN